MQTKRLSSSIYLIAAVLILGAPQASAASPDSVSRLLTLPELFAIGEQNSLSIKASHLYEQQAIERQKADRSQRLPSVTLSATVGYLGQPVVFGSGLTDPTHINTPDWSQNYWIQVTQAIYQGGRIEQNIRYSSIEKEIARLTTINNQADMKMRLLGHYINLFRLYKQQQVLQHNIEESQNRQRDIHNMLKEGLVTRNDEIRSDLQLTQDQLSLRTAKDAIILTSQQIDVELGLDERLLIVPDTTLLHQIDTPLEPYETYVELSYANYPEMLIAKNQTKLSQTDLKIAQASSLPSLNLVANNTLARPLANSMQDKFSNNWNVALDLTFNLSSLYKNNHRIGEKRRSVDISLNAENQTMQNLRILVQDAYVKHGQAQQQVEVLSLSVVQSQENYRIVRNRYLNQLAILTELLDATNVLLDAELQLTVARTNVVYTYYQLLRSCGNL